MVDKMIMMLSSTLEIFYILLSDFDFLYNVLNMDLEELISKEMSV